MNVVNMVINRIYGRRTKRLYLRLNPHQFAGLELLAHRSGKCPAEAAYGFILAELDRMRDVDVRFRIEWDRACTALMKESKS